MTAVKQEQREKVDRFEVAFNQIHTKLKELVKGESNRSFMNLLHKGRDRHTTIRYHFQELKQFAKLRNALVHERVKESFYIAEPHWEVINKLEHINEALQRPPYALTIASKHVLFFDQNADMKEVLSAIERYGYSQLPVYEDHAFKGLLTEGGLAKWLSKQINGNYIEVGGTSASDILYVEKPHNVAFLAKDKTVYDVEDLFEGYFDRNQKLEAILITETGSENEKPLGIITTWDLVQIDHTTVTLLG